jgi:hypothetical protein
MGSGQDRLTRGVGSMWAGNKAAYRVPYLSRQRHFLGAVNLERRLKKQA